MLRSLAQGEMAAVAAGSAPDMAAAFAGLAADAAALAGELLQLLGALADQNAALGEAAAAAGVQPPSAAAAATAPPAAEQQGEQPPASEALWAQIEASYAGFAPFRDASIDRWHRKTMLTTGEDHGGVCVASGALCFCHAVPVLCRQPCMARLWRPAPGALGRPPAAHPLLGSWHGQNNLSWQHGRDRSALLKLVAPGFVPPRCRRRRAARRAAQGAQPEREHPGGAADAGEDGWRAAPTRSRGISLSRAHDASTQPAADAVDQHRPLHGL